MRRLFVAIGVVIPAAMQPMLAAAPLPYEAPPETTELKPAPGIDTAKVYCGICHSVDYIVTQPRGPDFGENFWQAEVTKMIKTFGAPIPEADAMIIVDYLANAYR